MTDMTMISSIPSLPGGGVSSPYLTGIIELPRGVDIPSTITPATIPEPAEIEFTEPSIGPQTEGTSVGTGTLVIRSEFPHYILESLTLLRHYL